MKTPENSKTNLDDLIQKIKSEGIEKGKNITRQICYLPKGMSMAYFGLILVIMYYQTIPDKL